MRKTSVWVVGLILLSLPALAAVQPIYNVRDYGASGNGNTLDTAALQKAIDTAAKAGGGTVWFPAGRYLSGTLFLKDHIRLYLDAGATLLGSTKLADYPQNRSSVRSYTDNYVDRSLLAGEGLSHVSIAGQGTIDGQGSAYQSKEYLIRPYLIRLVNCENVSIEDITLQNSAMWMQHYLLCRDVTIRGITVRNLVTYNNDGLDIDSCQDVRISDCSIYSDDDAICLKSTTLTPCENITITNCVVGSHCNAIKMGTESNGGFKNISISNCTVLSLKDVGGLYGDRRGLAGIALEIVDGGVMDRVTISNIAMEGITTPIFIRLGNRARPFKADSPKPDIGILRNVLIQDIVANGVSKVGCSITGQPERAVENVTLRNIRLSFEGGGAAEDAGKSVERKPDAYPECTMFGTLPAYGFFSRHVKNLTFEQMDLHFENGEARPAAIFDDVLGLTLSRFVAKPASPAIPVIVFNQVKDARIQNSRAETGTDLYLYSQNSEDVFLSGNDLRNVKTEIKRVN